MPGQERQGAISPRWYASTCQRRGWARAAIGGNSIRVFLDPLAGNLQSAAAESCLARIAGPRDVRFGVRQRGTWTSFDNYPRRGDPGDFPRSAPRLSGVRFDDHPLDACDRPG